MIAFFNNSSMNWRVKPSQQKGTCDVSVAKKNKDGDSIILKIATPLDINVDAIGTSASTEILSIYDKHTTLYYDEKSNRPYIAEGKDTDNKDIFLIGIDIQNSLITDITRQDLFVIGFLITRNSLFLIASIKAGCEQFSITTFRKDNKIETKYIFHVGKDTNVSLADRSSVEIFYETKPTLRVEPCKIHSFRPSRSTHLLFINEKDRELAKTIEGSSKLFSFEKNNVVFFNDETEFSDKVKDACNNGYTAASIFTSLNKVTCDHFGEYDENVVLMRSVFDVNNIILGGITPPAVIKR